MGKLFNVKITDALRWHVALLYVVVSYINTIENLHGQPFQFQGLQEYSIQFVTQRYVGMSYCIHFQKAGINTN